MAERGGGALGRLPPEVLLKSIVRAHLAWEEREALATTCTYLWAVVEESWHGTELHLPPSKAPWAKQRLLPLAHAQGQAALPRLLHLGAQLVSLDLSPPSLLRPSLLEPLRHLRSLTLPAHLHRTLRPPAALFPALRSLTIGEAPLELAELRAALEGLSGLDTLDIYVPRRAGVEEFGAVLPERLRSLTLHFRYRLSLLPLWLASRPHLPRLSRLSLSSARPMASQNPVPIDLPAVFPGLQGLCLRNVLLADKGPVPRFGDLRELSWAPAPRCEVMSLGQLMGRVRAPWRPELLRKVRADLWGAEEKVRAEVAVVGQLAGVEELGLGLGWEQLGPRSPVAEELRVVLGGLGRLRRLELVALEGREATAAAVGGGGSLVGAARAASGAAGLEELSLEVLGGRGWAAAGESVAGLLGSRERRAGQRLLLQLPREGDARRLVSCVRARVPVARRHLVVPAWASPTPPRPAAPAHSTVSLGGKSYQLG